MTHSVSAPDAAAESLLRLVAEAGGVQHLNVTIDATSADVRFTAADGTPAFGAATACRWLASLGSAATQLLGETPEQAAKVRAATPNWGLAAVGGIVGGGAAASAAAVASGLVIAAPRAFIPPPPADRGVGQLPQRAAAPDGCAAGGAERGARIPHLHCGWVQPPPPPPCMADALL